MSILPKISIVTPVFNGEKYIEDTIISVLSQGYDNLEYIVIDGASTDNTLSIIKKYDQHISLILSEPDGGMYDALDKGLKLATGDLMAYLNSDDTYCKNALHKVANFYTANNRPDFLFGDCVIWDQETDCKVIYKSTKLPKKLHLVGRTPFCQQSAFWSRQLFERLGGFNSSLKYCGDYEFFTRAFFIPDLKVVRIPSTLSTFRWHNEMLSQSFDLMNQEFLDIQAKLKINRFPSYDICKITSEFILKIRNIKSTLTRKFNKRANKFLLYLKS